MELPDPVRRYFAASIRPGTPLARSARIQMRGSIKLGNKWLPFRAHQTESPHRGFRWTARVGGIIFGSDRYADGVGGMDWRLFGVLRVAHAEGDDVSRSAAGRGMAEAIWVPTALLPRFGVRWEAEDDTQLVAKYSLGSTEVALRYTMDSASRIRSVVFDRWGDPENTGMWNALPFGFEATAYSTFDGVTFPFSGRAGWYYGTERWPAGEFFRTTIFSYSLDR